MVVTVHVGPLCNFLKLYLLGSVLLSLVPQSQISSFHSDSSYGSSCGVFMKVSYFSYYFIPWFRISRNLHLRQSASIRGKKIFFARFLAHKMGYAWWVSGIWEFIEKLKDEDDATKVLPGYQFTMQVEEPSTAEYWFVFRENSFKMALLGSSYWLRVVSIPHAPGSTLMSKLISTIISG